MVVFVWCIFAYCIVYFFVCVFVFVCLIDFFENCWLVITLVRALDIRKQQKFNFEFLEEIFRRAF